jgi:hypothetical protein
MKAQRLQEGITVKRMQKGFQIWQPSKLLCEVIYCVYLFQLSAPLSEKPPTSCCLSTHSGVPLSISLPQILLKGKGHGYKDSSESTRINQNATA